MMEGDPGACAPEPCQASQEMRLDHVGLNDVGGAKLDERAQLRYDAMVEATTLINYVYPKSCCARRCNELVRRFALSHYAGRFAPLRGALEGDDRDFDAWPVIGAKGRRAG
jgi:hypothetical protein